MCESVFAKLVHCNTCFSSDLVLVFGDTCFRFAQTVEMLRLEAVRINFAGSPETMVAILQSQT